MAAGCCASSEKPESLSEVLKSAGTDPTLASCCARDLKEQAYVGWLKKKLLERDRTQDRLEVAACAVERDLASLPIEDQEINDSLDSGSEAADNELHDFRVRRLSELQARARQRVEVCEQGRGLLRDCTPEELQGLLIAEQAVVCHIYQPGDQAATEIDELLTILARQYDSTAFVRVSGRHSSRLSGVLRTCPPGVHSFMDGCLTGTSATAAWMELGFDELKMARWLQQVLKSSSSMKRPGSAASMSDVSTEDGDDWQEACQTCGRRYPHEHIRNLQNGGETAADSDCSE